MSDESILEKIGMQNADDATKQATIDTIKSTVEMRLMSTVSELLSDEQIAHLEDMEKAEQSHEDMFGYISSQLADIGLLYDDVLSSYIDEFVDKQKRLGLL